MLQSVGIRPEDMSGIDFAAEFKSRVSSDVNDDAGSGRKGRKVGEDGSVSDGRTDKRRSDKNGYRLTSTNGKVILGCTGWEDIPP